MMPVMKDIVTGLRNQSECRSAQASHANQSESTRTSAASTNAGQRSFELPPIALLLPQTKKARRCRRAFEIRQSVD
jgi:hypothetical protein